MQDLSLWRVESSSLTRDQTWDLCIGSVVLATGPPGKALSSGLLLEKKKWLKTQYSKNKDHGIQSHYFMANRWGESSRYQISFSWAPKSLSMVTAAMKLKDTCSLEEKL